MNLTTIFESWYIPDGTYPILRRGQQVRLSFEIMLNSLAKTSAGARVSGSDTADYRISAQVIRKYRGDGAPLVVFEAGDFRFYNFGERTVHCDVGDWVELVGTLHVDHYGWVENLKTFIDPPDLFYNFVVSHIRRVRIPERFIARGEKTLSSPTSLPGSEYTEGDWDAVEEMDDPDDAALGFYLLDLDGTGLEAAQIPLTFLTAGA